MPNTPDTFSYKGWMNSDSFIKRTFGVFGYNLVASLIVQAVIMALVMVVFVMIGGTAMIAGLFNR
jgi:hypothetical protein